MKKLVLVVLLLSAFSFGANKPNPADYNVNVHVSASSMVPNTNGPGYFPSLNVEIAGVNYQLLGERFFDLLALGDYKARLVKDQHNSAYESLQVYEFLFPDGKTMKFDVTGVSE